MLNHFYNNSKRSFNFNEKRLVHFSFDQYDGELDVAGEFDPDRKNERLNQGNFEDFQDKIDEIAKLDISKPTRRVRNMFEQLRELFKDEGGLDRRTAAQLAAEFTDALSDNPGYMNQYGINGIRNPFRVFSSTGIENGELVLDARNGQDFSINIRTLKSDAYNEFFRQQSAATSRTTETARTERRELDPEAPTARPEQQEAPTPASASAPSPAPTREASEAEQLATRNEATQLYFRDTEYSDRTVEQWRATAIDDPTSENFSTFGTQLIAAANDTENDLTDAERERYSNDARNAYEYAVSLDPQNEDAQTNLTRLLVDDNMDADDAEEYVESVVSNNEELNPQEGPTSRPSLIDPRLQAMMDADNEAFTLDTITSLEGAIANIDDYSTFDLPEEFRQHYSPQALRLLFTSGRIAGSETIISELNDLGIDLNSLQQILELQSGNLENGLGIQTVNFLSNSPFNNEDLATFLQQTLDLMQADDLAPHIRQELVARVAYYQKINSVIGRLTNLEMIETDQMESLTDLNPDNIRRVNFSRELRRQISDRIPGFEGTISRADNDSEKILMAFYTYIYGPLDRIMASDDVEISVHSFAEDRIIQNSRRENQLQLEITNLPEAHLDAIATLYGRYGTEMVETEARESNLTDALNSIRRHEDYQEIMDFVFQAKLEALGDNPDQQALVFHHLTQVFDVQTAGMMRHRGRGTVSDIDEMGGTTTRIENVDDFLTERISDLSMYHFIADEMGISLNPNNMTTANLAETLSLYLDLGSSTFNLTNPGLRTTNPELVGQMNEANIVTKDDLQNPSFRFSEAQILAIKYGVLFEAQTAIARARALQNLNEGLDNEMYVEIAEFWARDNQIPDEAIAILSRQTYGILSTLDFTEGIENTRFGAGALLSLGFGAYIDEDGNWQVSVDVPDDMRSYITITGGTVVDRSMLISPGFSVGIEVGHVFENGGGAQAGISARRTGMTVYLGGRTREGRRGWAFEGGAGATAGDFTSLFVRAGVNRSQEGVLNTNIRKAIEKNEFGEIFMDGESVNIELVRNIVDGQVSNAELLTIANGSESLSEMFDTSIDEIRSNPVLAERFGSDIETYINAAKINFIQTLATIIVNEGVRNVGPYLSDVAVVFTTTPPFIIPILGFSAGGRMRVYPSGMSDSESRGLSSALIAEQIAAMENLAPDTIIEFSINGSITTISADGKYVAVEIFDSENEVIDTIEGMNDAQTALNQQTPVTGLSFEQVTGSDNYTWAFRFENGDLSQYGLGQTTEILTDRYSGIQIEQIEPGLFGIVWGSSPQTPPPGDLVITREAIIDNSGQNPTHTIICLSRGNYTPTETIRSNRFNSSIYIDESGNSRVEDGSHSYDRGFYERQAAPELDIADYEYSDMLDEARRSQAMFAASEAQISTLEFDATGHQIDPTVIETVNELLQDSEFIEELASLTTATETDLPDYEEVAGLINARLGGEATDVELAYVISRLMPSTYVAAERIEDIDDRIDAIINVATIITEAKIREVAANIGYNPEKINDLADAITNMARENLQTNEALREALSQTPINTQTLTEALGANGNNVATAFTVAAWSNMPVSGLRQLIFTPGELSPQIVENSVQELDLGNADQVAIAEFLNTLYERTPGNIDLSDPNFINSQQFREIFTSRSSVELLSLTLDTNDSGQRLGLINFLIGDPSIVVYITQLRESIIAGDREFPTPTPDQQKALAFITENIINLMNAGPTTESIQLTNPYDSEFSIDIPLQTNSGTMLIYPCANLSFYYGRSIQVEGQLQIPPRYSVLTARGRLAEVGNPGRDALSTNFTAEVAGIFDVSRNDTPPDEEGKHDGTMGTEEETQHNADGQAYLDEGPVGGQRPNGEKVPRPSQNPTPVSRPVSGPLEGDDTRDTGLFGSL